MMPWNRIGRVMVCYKGGGGSSGPVITDDMVEQAKVSVDQWNNYITEHLPMVQQYIGQKTDTGRDSRMENKLRGSFGADMAQRTSAGTVQAGVDPSKSLTVQGVGRDAAGKAAGQGAVEVTANYGDRKVNELGNIVATGRGQKIEAMQGFNELAAASAEEAITKARLDQQKRFASDAGLQQMIGAGVGLMTTGLSFGADQGWFGGKQQVELSPNGNNYSFNSSTNKFDVTPKSSGGYSLLQGGLNY